MEIFLYQDGYGFPESNSRLARGVFTPATMIGEDKTLKIEEIETEPELTLPPLPDDSFHKLVEDIDRNGIVDQLVVGELNGRHIIVTGGHHLRALKELGHSEVLCKVFSFTDDLHLRLFFLLRNLMLQQHMSDAQRIEIVLKFEDDVKKIAKLRQGGNPIPEEYLEVFPDLRRLKSVHTDKFLASIASVSTGNLANYRNIKKDGRLTEKVLSGKMTINRAIKEIEKERANNIKKAELEKRLKNIATANLQPIFYPGDFRNESLKITENSIDFVLTDPPYSLMDFSHAEIDALAKVIFRVVKEGRQAAIVYGNENLNVLIKTFEDRGLTYDRTISVDLETNAPYWPGHYTVMWKPVVIFRKGKCEHHTFINDRITDSQNEKFTSRWQQSSVLFEKLIESFSRAGDIVFDPMLGRGGTTIKAGLEAQRKVIGCEKEPKAIVKIEKMLGLINEGIVRQNICYHFECCDKYNNPVTPSGVTID